MRKSARNNSLWFFPLCLAFVAVLVLVRSRVWESANLRQAAWRTAGPFWRTGGALRKAQCAAGRSLGRLQSRFLAHFAHRFRITDVVLSLWGVGVSALGKFPGGGRFVCRGACTGGKHAQVAREGFRSLGRLRNAAHGGAPAGARTAVLVRQGRRDPPSGRVFGRSGGCRPGR